MRTFFNILFCLCSLLAFGQYGGKYQQKSNSPTDVYGDYEITIEDELDYYGTYSSSMYRDWNLSNETCYGCTSFYWGITRSKYKDVYGQYWYDIYFLSNSYNAYGYRASTVVYNIYVYLNGDKMNSEPFWVYFFDSYSHYGMRVKTKAKYPNIKISWGKVGFYN